MKFLCACVLTLTSFGGVTAADAAVVTLPARQRAVVDSVVASVTSSDSLADVVGTYVQTGLPLGGSTQLSSADQRVGAAWIDGQPADVRLMHFGSVDFHGFHRATPNMSEILNNGLGLTRANWWHQHVAGSRGNVSPVVLRDYVRGAVTVAYRVVPRQGVPTAASPCCHDTTIIVRQLTPAMPNWEPSTMQFGGLGYAVLATTDITFRTPVVDVAIGKGPAQFYLTGGEDFRTTTDRTDREQLLITGGLRYGWNTYVQIGGIYAARLYDGHYTEDAAGGLLAVGQRWLGRRAYLSLTGGAALVNLRRVEFTDRRGHTSPLPISDCGCSKRTIDTSFEPAVYGQAIIGIHF